MAAPESNPHPHILLATDRSKGSAPHLAFATRLGNALGARTTLFHAVRPRQLVVNAALDPADTPVGEDAEEARQSLTDTASTLGADRPVHVAVDDTKEARDAILEAADRIDADLIVLPTHGRTGISRAVIGSTAEQVMRRSKRPVLLLTDHMLENESPAIGERGPMILATDLSPESVVAHLPAAQLAKQLGLKLHLLSVLREHVSAPYQGGAPVAPPPPDSPERINECTKQLCEYAAKLSPEVEVEVEACINDDSAGAITQSAADLKASLLVLTTHGRRGIARMIQGSVAERVVRQSTVPVLVMPAEKL